MANTNTSAKKTLFVFENTRKVVVRLMPSVTPEAFATLINERRVSLIGDQLTDGRGTILGARIRSDNASDYKLAADQSPMPTLDAIDLYEKHFNEI
jgi:hypothetical protein